MILLLCFLFFIPALKYHYVVDDLAVLDATEKSGRAKPKNKLELLWVVFRGHGYWTDKESTIMAHTTPIIIHFVTCWLIYFAFGKTPVAYLAAILFALHPINTEVSVWLSAKHYGTSAIVMLLAWWFPLAAPVLFIFSPVWLLFFNGIFAPLVFLLHPTWSVMAILTIWLVRRNMKLMFDFKGSKLVSFAKNKEALKISPAKIIIALKFYGYYLVNNIFGIHYCFYQSYMDDFLDTQEGIKKGKKIDIYFWVGLVAIYILITNLIWNYNWMGKGIPNMAVFGLFWATVNIAMWCNIITIGQQYVSNRQCYLANIGLMLMLASILVEYPYAAGVLVGWYARQLILARRQYENNYWHFFYHLADEPRFYYGWINRGNLSHVRGQFGAAISDYLQALELRPNNFKALFNLSSAWIGRGNVLKAIKYFELARKADVYAQEKTRDDVVARRMELINAVVSARGNLKLKISDIPVVA